MICAGFLDSLTSILVVSDGVTLVFSVDLLGLKGPGSPIRHGRHLLQQDSVRTQRLKSLSDRGQSLFRSGRQASCHGHQNLNSNLDSETTRRHSFNCFHKIIIAPHKLEVLE